MLPRWNLTPHLFAYRNAEVLVLSIGKSGRTWLRVLLNKYLALHFGADFSVQDLNRKCAAIPRLLYDHEAWSHYSDTPWYKQALGRNIAPASVLNARRVIFLFRDPRDVVVSLYFQKTRRSRNPIDTDISSFIRHPRYGILSIVRVMNLWHNRLSDHDRCATVSYETLKQDTRNQALQLLEFIGVTPVNHERLEQAIEFSAFNNMQKMEAAGQFQSRILSPRDPDDLNSYKVREGGSGTYIQHFDAPDLLFLDAAIGQLDPWFGYRPSRNQSPNRLTQAPTR